MKRRREQRGTIYAKSGAWYVRYSDFRVTDGKLERKRLSHQLGSTAEITKRRAREEAQRFLGSINHAVLQPETAVTLVAFVEKGYFPHVEKRLRPSTLRSYRVEWDAQLKPYCANLWTRDTRTSHLQSILDTMAATDRFNVCSLQRIKSFLSGVFRLAIQQGYYAGSNPVRETSIPAARRSDETYAYSLAEVLTMIQAVPEPAATLLATAAFTGVRRGELRGMRWENYRDGEMLIAQSVWNGITTEPKSKKSKAPIPIIGWLANKLLFHRQRLGNPISGPVFPNHTGKPMDPNNALNRVILPALNVCETCSKPKSEHVRANHEYKRNSVLPEWHGWHGFRRGLATNLHQMGVDDLTIQAILRHSHVSVTQACYIKTASSETKAAMQKMETALTDSQVTPRQVPSTNRSVQ